MAMAAEPPLGADEIWAAETLLMLSLGHLRRPPPTTLPVTAATTPKPTTTADVRIKKIRFTFSGRPPLPYVCDVCGDSFPSHQALGGHKTRHRPKSSAAAAASSAANNQGHKRKQYEGIMVSAEKTKRRNIDVGDLKRQERAKVLDFNLNLPYIQID